MGVQMSPSKFLQAAVVVTLLVILSAWLRYEFYENVSRELLSHVQWLDAISFTALLVFAGILFCWDRYLN